MDEKVIYIIIAIIWIVSSLIKAVNKANKKKPTVQAPPTSTTRPVSELDDFKKILEDMISGKETEITKPQPVKERAPATEETFIPETQSKYAEYQGALEYSFSNYTTMEEYIESNKNRFTFDDNKVYESAEIKGQDIEVFKQIDDDFDLRKGILYSEILKRPHY